MNEASSNIGNKDTGGESRPVLDAFGLANLPVAPVAAEDTPVPFDVEIGRDIARQVSQRGATSRLSAKSGAVDAAAVGMEPEIVGGRGSPHRRCIVTGDILPYDQMIRFVLDPQDIVTPDLAASLPGRGYWVTGKYPILQKAFGSECFSRAARRKAIVPPALIDTVISLSRRACLSSLGLARRAWAVDYGYEAVRQALNTQKAGLVLVARNAPTEFVGKLENVRGQVPVNTLFTTAELSDALGRDHLAFVAVTKGQWTQRLLLECARLAQVLS